MKVTKREQMLLAALLIVLLGYGFYHFVYAKQNEKITQLKASKDTYSQKWEQVKAKIASKDKKNEQYKILNAKIVSKTDMLFLSIEQEKIIVVLDKMIKDSKLQVEVLGFSEVSSDNTTEDKSKINTEIKEKITINELDKLVNDFNGTLDKDAITEKTNTSKAELNNATTKTVDSKIVGAYTMEVTLAFKGKYDELISFIEQVENYDKKIIINNINMAAVEGSTVSGNIILEFYGIPKFNDNDKFKWDYKKPIGKKNPFVGGNISVTGSQVLNTVVTKKEDIQYDFLMSVSSITSDLPTIMLGKSKDSLRNTYVYADNEGEENVEIYLVQSDGKYFYKYKTIGDAYPKDFNTQKEFIPYEKDIKFKIYTNKRNSGVDLAGANIKIFNKTDLTVNIDIEDDDKDKPRVKISKETGNINVNKL
ncbi:hypothetical protein [Clostridium sp.]|uniref:hypothetical protein n=1 Tax=Clostridium sp. TaxID=1506 RepID=UPI003D6C8550